MVYYQSQPYGNYYNPMANRAFLMQYASQPVRRQAVSAFASGKKISAGTYLKGKFGIKGNFLNRIVLWIK